VVSPGYHSNSVSISLCRISMAGPLVDGMVVSPGYYDLHILCTGEETTIENCQHDRWGQHDSNCDHSDDVGVVYNDPGLHAFTCPVWTNCITHKVTLTQRSAARKPNIDQRSGQVGDGSGMTRDQRVDAFFGKNYEADCHNALEEDLNTRQSSIFTDR
jgi:hypothetical protein